MISVAQYKGSDSRRKLDVTLDALGLFCPEPIFRLRKALDRMSPGQLLEMVADDPAAEEDVERFLKRTGHEMVEFVKEGSELRFVIRKSDGGK